MGNDFIHQKNESTFLVMESWRKGTFFFPKTLFFLEIWVGIFTETARKNNKGRGGFFFFLTPLCMGRREKGILHQILFFLIYIYIFFFLHASYQLDSEKNVEERAQQTNKHEFLYLFMIGGGGGSFFLKKYGTARTLHPHM